MSPDASLEHALAEGWAEREKSAMWSVAALEVAILAAGLARGVAGAASCMATALCVSLALAALALSTARPRSYAARWRLPLITVARMCHM